jgi:hypothetical protein
MALADQHNGTLLAVAGADVAAAPPMTVVVAVISAEPHTDVVVVIVVPVAAVPVVVAAMTMTVPRLERRRKGQCHQRRQGNERNAEKGFHGAGVLVIQ